MPHAQSTCHGLRVVCIIRHCQHILHARVDKRDKSPAPAGMDEALGILGESTYRVVSSHIHPQYLGHGASRYVQPPGFGQALFFAATIMDREDVQPLSLGQLFFVPICELHGACYPTTSVRN